MKHKKRYPSKHDPYNPEDAHHYSIRLDKNGRWDWVWFEYNSEAGRIQDCDGSTGDFALESEATEDAAKDWAGSGDGEGSPLHRELMRAVTKLRKVGE